MEHYDVGSDARLAALIAAAERGDEAVLTRGGVAVAEVRPIGRGDRAPKGPIDLEALHALHARFPSMRVDDATALIREMRDEDDH